MNLPAGPVRPANEVAGRRRRFAAAGYASRRQRRFHGRLRRCPSGGATAQAARPPCPARARRPRALWAREGGMEGDEAPVRRTAGALGGPAGRLGPEPGRACQSEFTLENAGEVAGVPEISITSQHAGVLEMLAIKVQTRPRPQHRPGTGSLAGPPGRAGPPGSRNGPSRAGRSLLSPPGTAATPPPAGLSAAASRWETVGRGRSSVFDAVFAGEAAGALQKV